MRHSGRVAAIQLLYGLDTCGKLDAAEEALPLHFAHLDPEIDGEVRAFAEELCRGVVANLEQLDTALERAASNWRVSRMSRVDRNILRLAAYELLCAREVPPRVVLDEAIELAKELGSGESGAFVNGVLNKLIGDAGLAVDGPR